MQRRLDLHPVIAIPYIPTAWERQRRRLTWIAGIAAVVFAFPFAIEAIDTHVMPIEQLAAKVGLGGLLDGFQERTGWQLDLPTRNEG